MWNLLGKEDISNNHFLQKESINNSNIYFMLV